MYKDSNEINHRVREHFNYVREQGYNPIFCGLVGSQNYGLDTEESDVDTKCIVLPTLDDIVFGRAPISKTLHLENGEQIDVKDIREMMKCWKKQNINFVELLFTKYYCDNLNYSYEIKDMLAIRDRISRYDNYAFANCCKGMSQEKLHALCHPYPTISWKIDKWGYDGKQLSHIIRMKEFVSNFLYDDMDYNSCLTARGEERMMQIFAKKQQFTLDEAKRLAKEYDNIVVSLVDSYKGDNKRVIDNDVMKILESIVRKCIVKSIRMEIG